ncbi:hypothetical protein O2K51_01190 [Apibacter raozihei]|uniref:hypothetical protein n=1 Tax=Apibacter raozihei TaxID=2500547 RepID=UPI000FE2B8D7|nr:hypothetical protein [Apibacter raozihei]
MFEGKIIRTIGGESVKKASYSLRLTATQSDLTFNSPTQVVINGKQGGVEYRNDYVPEKEEDKITEVIQLEITKEITGYTLQDLKGFEKAVVKTNGDFGISYYDTAVIVPTYKTNIKKVKITKDGNILSQETAGEFDVTRDAWYYLGATEFKEYNIPVEGKYKLLNRAFVPSSYTENLYDTIEVANYPKFTIFGAHAKAYILTCSGNRKIAAQPLETMQTLDGRKISGTRADPGFATDVMVHIGGYYTVDILGKRLGGSYGCFGFIQKENILLTPELARKASESLDPSSLDPKSNAFAVHTSNSAWKKITNQIDTLCAQRKLQILLLDRDETKNYIPDEILYIDAYIPVES